MIAEPDGNGKDGHQDDPEEILAPEIDLTVPAYPCLFWVAMRWAGIEGTQATLHKLEIIPEPPKKGMSFKVGDSYPKVHSVDYDLMDRVYRVKLYQMVFPTEEEFNTMSDRFVCRYGWVPGPF